MFELFDAEASSNFRNFVSNQLREHNSRGVGVPIDKCINVSAGEHHRTAMIVDRNIQCLPHLGKIQVFAKSNDIKWDTES